MWRAVVCAPETPAFFPRRVIRCCCLEKSLPCLWALLHGTSTPRCARLYNRCPERGDSCGIATGRCSAGEPRFAWLPERHVLYLAGAFHGGILLPLGLSSLQCLRLASRSGNPNSRVGARFEFISYAPRTVVWCCARSVLYNPHRCILAGASPRGGRGTRRLGSLVHLCVHYQSNVVVWRAAFVQRRLHRCRYE
jgi:hypothetical protein